MILEKKKTKKIKYFAIMILLFLEIFKNGMNAFLKQYDSIVKKIFCDAPIG